MKLPATIILIFISAFAHAQIASQSSLKDSLLFKGKYKGHINQIYKWKDKAGENYLLLSSTSETVSKAKVSSFGTDCEGDCTDKELYAYHFLGRDSLLCKVQDFEKACGFDIIAEFRLEATKITDLDSNGFAEVWFMYSKACNSDVSPNTLKMMMFQKGKKYAVRGTSQPSANMIIKEEGGKYFPDEAFLSLPATMKNFGKMLWKKNLYDYH